jgi:hypothetical protein
MPISSKTNALLSLASNPRLITCRTKYLFLFSHMRSRSSVLSHILGSSSDITGYTELQIPYLTRAHLLKMKLLLYQDFKIDLQGQYLLDKILHNKVAFSSEILRVANPKIIFLLRKPKDTIKSIVHMNLVTGIRDYSTVEEALEYYCSRLLQLERLSKKMSGRYFFVESDELIDNADEVLSRLSDWLQLENKLSKYYSTFEKTGTPGFGDPLENIKSGVLRKTRKISNIKIPSRILQKAELSYEKCKLSLLSSTAQQFVCSDT